MGSIALDNRPNNQPDGWLLACLEQVLRPIIRLFLSRRVAYPAFAEVAKRIYIELAREDAAKDNPRQPVTVSELAIASGIDVQSINQHIQDNDKAAVKTPDLSPEAHILSDWSENATYRDSKTGQPLELPIRGAGLTFATLVRRAQRNVSYGHVLDRLLESENVQITQDGRCVKLINRWYKSEKVSTAKIMSVMEAACRCIRHFLSTLNRNVDEVSHGRSPTYYQQERYSRKISPQQLDRFRTICIDMLREQTQHSVDAMEPMEEPVRTDEHIVAGVGYYYFELS